MHESDTYMAIIEEGREEGREEEAKKVILRLAQKRFGAAGEAIQAKLNAIKDFSRLERVEDRLLDATNWQDILDTP